VIAAIFGLDVPHDIGVFGEIDYVGNLLVTLSSSKCFISVPAIWQSPGLKTMIFAIADSQVVIDQKPKVAKRKEDLKVIGCKNMFEVIKLVFKT